MLNLKQKGGQPPNSVSVDNNNYVLWKSAEIPVFSMREGTHIYPPLPDLGSTEPIEDLIGDLDIYENRAPKLRLPNGVRLSYNDIIALAGTFYGIEGSIIVTLEMRLTLLNLREHTTIWPCEIQIQFNLSWINS